jgi:formylglycine-generating enzyme required for sulfatase activity
MVVVPPGSFMMGTTDAEIAVEVEQSKREGYSAGLRDME